MQAFTGLGSFDPVPSVGQSKAVSITVGRKSPEAQFSGALISPGATLPDQVSVDWGSLTAAGFVASVGQTLTLPQTEGSTLVLVGIGPESDLDADKLRDAAAAFARATESSGNLELSIADAGAVSPALAAQVVVEGVLLARYRFDALKERPDRHADHDLEPGGRR